MASKCISARPAVMPVTIRVSSRTQQPARSVRVAAVDGIYQPLTPDMDFVHAVLDAFPDAAVANPEEARALYTKGGYKWFDIRHNVDIDTYGKVRDAVCIPFELAKKSFVDGAVEVTTSPNPDFMDAVEARFPDRDVQLLVGDMRGEVAIEALEMLDEAGYTNIVGLKGGYLAWMKTWDNKLLRRNLGEYQEDPYGEGGASCGIHASGAGFKNQDAASADFWAGV